MRRLAALESLRGLLALWVLCGHVVIRAGYTGKNVGLLAHPSLAVFGFIILSGFVIFYLLDQEKQSYSTFILGRFFRIVPLYLICLSVSAAMINFQFGVIDKLQWVNHDIENEIAIHKESVKHFWPHLAAHATLLQGLLDDSILKYSDFALLGQAWSVSLEWQFYLIVPFICYLITSRRWAALTAILVLMCLGKWISYGGPGFLLNQSGYFAIGILSFLAFKNWRAEGWSVGVIDTLMCAAIAVVYLVSDNPWPLIVWVAVLTSVIGQHQGVNGPLCAFIVGIMEHRSLRWVGRVSYSIYLTHMLIFSLVAGILLRLDPNVSSVKFLLVVLPGTLTCTLLLSSLTYRFIEAPGIAFGKRLVKRGSAGLVLVGASGKRVPGSLA